MAERFEIVPMNDQQIMTVRTNDGIYVVMKPIVEALGLTWNAQRERIQRHPVLSKGARMIRVPSPGGMQDMLCLSLEHFHGWLVTLDPRNVKDEQRREIIIMYQANAFRVIHEHHHGKANTPQISMQNVRAMKALQDQYLKLIDKLVITRDTGRRQAIYDLIVSIADQLGTVTPALADLGKEAPTVPHVLDRFFSLIAQLEGSGYEINHHRVAGMLALNLVEVREMFKREGISFDARGQDFTKALRTSTSPRFVNNTTVNSRYRGKAVSCWVFAVEP